MRQPTRSRRSSTSWPTRWTTTTHRRRPRGARAPLAVPLGPGDRRHRRRAAGHVPPARVARARRVPIDDDAIGPCSTSRSRRATPRTRRSRGRSPAPTGRARRAWRRRPTRMQHRCAEQRALPSAGHACGCPHEEGGSHGPANKMVEHHVWTRGRVRSSAPRRSPTSSSTRRSRSRSRGSTTTRRCARCCPA